MTFRTKSACAGNGANPNTARDQVGCPKGSPKRGSCAFCTKYIAGDSELDIFLELCCSGEMDRARVIFRRSLHMLLDGYCVYCERIRNRLMHALNGNIDCERRDYYDLYDEFELYREQMEEYDAIDNAYDYIEELKWIYTLEYIDDEYYDVPEIKGDWMNNFSSGILQLGWNKLMHALNGNVERLERVVSMEPGLERDEELLLIVYDETEVIKERGSFKEVQLMSLYQIIAGVLTGEEAKHELWNLYEDLDEDLTADFEVIKAREQQMRDFAGWVQDQAIPNYFDYDKYLADARNAFMHALNGNTDKEFEQEAVAQRILAGEAKYADYLLLKDCSNARLVQLFGSVAESKRYEQLTKVLNSKTKVREYKRIKVKKQHFVEEKNERFSSLELTGELADAREVFNCGLKPRERNFTDREYKRLLRVLQMLEEKQKSERHTTQGPKQTMDKIMGFIGNVKGHISVLITALSHHEQIFEEVRKIISYLPTLPTIVATLSTLIGDLVAALTLSGARLWAFLISRVVAYGATIGEMSLGLRESVSKLISFFEEQIKGNDESKEKTQGADEHVGMAIFKLVGHLLFNWGDVKINETRAKRISALFASMNTLHTFVTKFTEPFKEMFNWITESAFGILIFDVVPLELAKELREKGLEIGKYLQMSLAHMDVVTAREIETLYKEATDLYTTLAQIEGHHWVTWIDQYKVFKSFIYSQAKVVLASQLTRPEPLGLYFTGPPGIGKTSLVRRMATDAEAIFFDKRVEGSPVYEKPQTSTYFEGYFGEFVTMVDEFLMATDKEVNHANGSFVIAANSTVALALDMAFDRKGEVYYTSRITATAGNTPDPRWTETGHMFFGSVARRLFCVDVTPGKDYNLELGKWTKDIGLIDAATDYTFTVWDYMTTSTAEPKRNRQLCSGSYKDFMRWVMKELIKRDDAFILSSLQSKDVGFEQAIAGLDGGKAANTAITAFSMSYEDGLALLTKTYGKDHVLVKHYETRIKARKWLFGSKSESSETIKEEEKQEILEINEISDSGEETTPLLKEKTQMDTIRKLFWKKRPDMFAITKPPENVKEADWLMQAFAEQLENWFEKRYNITDLGYDLGVLVYSYWASMNPGTTLESILDVSNIVGLSYTNLCPNLDMKYIHLHTPTEVTVASVMTQFRALTGEESAYRVKGHTNNYYNVVGVPAYLRFAHFLEKQTKALANAVLQHWKMIALGFIAIVGAIGTCWLIFNPSEDGEETQILYEHGMPKAPVRRRNLTKVFVKAKTQVSDPTLLEQSRVVSNAFGQLQVSTTMPDADPFVLSGKVFNICGTCIIANIHLFAAAIGEAETEEEINKLKPYSTLSLWVAGVYIENIPFMHCKVVPWITEDGSVMNDMFTIVVPGRYMMAGRDLRGYFLDESEFDDRLEHNVVRITPMDPTDHLAGVFVERAGAGRYRYVNPRAGITTAEPVCAEEDNTGASFTTTHCIEYAIKSTPGHCMSLYAIDNTLAKHKFFGAHVAGRGENYGECAIISQQFLDKFVTPYYHPSTQRGAVTQGDPIDLGNTNEPMELLPVEDSIYRAQIPKQSKVLGRVDKKFLNYINRDTSIVRTRLFHEEKCHRRPAALRKVGGVDPFEKGLAREAEVDYRCDDPVIDIAWRKYEKEVFKLKVGVPGLLSVPEAVNRHVNSEHLQTMRQGTSAGAFLKQNSGGIPGKQAYIVDKHSDDFMAFEATEKFVGAIAAFEEKLEEGVIPIVPYLETMKDELRDNLKVDQLKTRLFKAGSAVHYVSEKRYNGAFHEMIRSDPWVTRNMVGVNMNGKFGQKLYEEIARGRPIIWDIRNNDNTRHRDGKWRYNQMKMRYMRRVDLDEFMRKGVIGAEAQGELIRRDHVRAALEEFNQSPVYQVGDILFQKMMTVASGDGQTFDQNSVINTVETDAAALFLIRKHKPDLYEDITKNMDFEKYWTSVHAGDDALMTVLDRRLDFITFESMQYALWKLFHTEATPASKSRYHKVMKDGIYDPTLAKVVEPEETDVTLKTMNFLGRTPSPFLKKYVCWQLNESTIHAIPFWRLKNHIGNDAMETQLCDQALMEWFYYGEKVFSYWKAKYDAELTRVGAEATGLTWQKALKDWGEAQC